MTSPRPRVRHPRAAPPRRGPDAADRPDAADVLPTRRSVIISVVENAIDRLGQPRDAGTSPVIGQHLLHDDLDVAADHRGQLASRSPEPPRLRASRWAGRQPVRQVR